MPTVLYPAFAEAEPPAGYRADFPDLPGCAAHGATLGDLLVNAREALRKHLQGFTEKGDEWPAASAMETLGPRQGPKTTGLILVDVEIEDAPVRVNISIGEQLLKRIDQAAEARGMTRSGFIAQAARSQLDSPGRAGFRTADEQWDTAAFQAQMAETGRRIGEAFGPGSQFQAGMKELERRIREEAKGASETLSAALRSGKPREPAPTPEPPKDETAPH